MFFGEEQTKYDNLIAGQILHESPITLVLGEDLKRGAVLGEIKFAPGTPVPGGTNTGDGVVQNVEARNESLVGNYRIECIEAVVGAGRFKVEAPDGSRLADVEVGIGYDNEFIAFDLVAGAVDFVKGDYFVIPINKHSDAGKYKLSNFSATDGSQIPSMILATDTNALSGDKKSHAYDCGVFNQRALIFGTGHDKDTVAAAFREQHSCMFLEDSISQ